MNQQRPHAARHASPRRNPWHIDYLHQRELLRDIVRVGGIHAHGRLLDVGCGQRPYAAWLPAITEYVGIDITPQAGTPSVCGLAYALPFGDCSVDTVLCTQTLEHVEEPQRTMAEMARVLRPGGFLILSVPQTWRLHEQPYDFYRYTRYGLRYMLEQSGLQVIEITPQGGVWMTIGQTLNNALHQRIRRHLPVYVLYVLYLMSNIFFGTLDRLWIDTDETLNYLAVAQKP
jgi:SAM-dependent methyltransferase